MPHYNIQVVKGRKVINPMGVEFPNDEAAKRHAEQVASGLTALSHPIDIMNGRGYAFHEKQAVDQHINSAWRWLEREGYIEPSPGINGIHGWRVFTAKGRAVAQGQDMRALRDAAEFPKSLLHPVIRESAWTAVVRSTNGTTGTALLDAVRDAFVKVEEAVRDAGVTTRRISASL
jgi:hypothetical protein